jgi:hypothetical protein
MLRGNLANQERSRGDAGLNRTGKAQQRVPVPLHQPHLAFAANDRRQRLVGCGGLERVELFVRQVANSGGKPCPQQMAESKHMVGKAGRIGVNLLDGKVSLMIQKAINDIGGVSGSCRDGLGIKGGVLIGNVGVEQR